MKAVPIFPPGSGGSPHRAGGGADVRPADESHIPVLLDVVLALLDVRPSDRIVDLTVGFGGHAAPMAEAAGAGGFLLGLDADPPSLQRAATRLAGAPGRIELRHGNFADFDEAMRSAGMEQADVMLADLGVSSAQLDDVARGFSFLRDGPLDMRLDPTATKTAEGLVNALPESKLADLIYEFGQERASRRIARRICEARRSHRIRSTMELATIVSRALGADPASRRSKIHPATRTFQALRIAVNDELESLKTMLEKAQMHLAVGGRIAVISFHSLEDAIVKASFRAWSSAGGCEILTKRPQTADPKERASNPRSRSAKLRVARRIALQDSS